jgi:hypothetical protein
MGRRQLSLTPAFNNSRHRTQLTWQRCTWSEASSEYYMRRWWPSCHLSSISPSLHPSEKYRLGVIRVYRLRRPSLAGHVRQPEGILRSDTCSTAKSLTYWWRWRTVCLAEAKIQNRKINSGRWDGVTSKPSDLSNVMY